LIYLKTGGRPQPILKLSDQPQEYSMYERILVPIDGSPTSTRGIDEAIRLANLSKGRIRLVHIIDELSYALAMDAAWGAAVNWIDVLHEQGARLLEEATTRVRNAGVAVEGVLFESFAGTVDQQVIKEVTEWKADVIVLGTHGRRGIRRAVLGSSAERILRISPVPVLLIRAPEEITEAPSVVAEPATRVNLPSAALSIEHV
jgi:nucleotide-binding universal stress UspA family protein